MLLGANLKQELLSLQAETALSLHTKRFLAVELRQTDKLLLQISQIANSKEKLASQTSGCAILGSVARDKAQSTRARPTMQAQTSTPTPSSTLWAQS